MEAINGKVDGAGGAQGSLPAAEWNQLPTEVQNVITQLDQTLASGDLNQLGKSIAGYVANGDFYTDSGSANSYTLTKIGTKQAPTAYTDGQRARFIAGNANTAASTVNVNALGTKNIKLVGGLDPAAGDIAGRVDLVFDSGNDWFELINPKISGVASSAADQSYDNSTTGLTAVDVQAALDEGIGSGQNRVASAWVNFNGTGVVSIRDSYNVSSITDNGTGDYTVNFATALANANYCPVFGYDHGAATDSTSFGKSSASPATVSALRTLYSFGATPADRDYLTVVIFGGL